ncbi:endo alpha-1,4 polygalactosaminidase precursor [Fusarium longipes]|uniref:alpha-galactosidase n=1 Tax=Fusarium longipes TaxID=694270 RepID=A0A395RP41_9HYPO|nr:endo alpha-1,4 polygalactosaminidase precursor [Fusarium longipes]
MVTFGRIAVTALALDAFGSARRKDERTTPSVAPLKLSDIKPVVEWEIVFHQPIQHDSTVDLKPVKAKVWDTDMGHARDYPKIIPSEGTRVLLDNYIRKFIVCCFNAGAVQSWDEDKDKFPKAALGRSLAYPYDSEEWYLDICDPTVLEIQRARLDVAAKIGCDAVDPDNVNARQQDEDDPTGLSSGLKTKDGNPLLIGQKKAPESAEDLVSILDFAVLGSCRGTTDDSEEESWPFCEDFQIYIDTDKPVLQIEYPPSVEKTGKFSSSIRASARLLSGRLLNLMVGVQYSV